VDGSKFGSAAAKFIVRSRDFFGPCPTVHVVSVLPDMERWLTNHSVGFESIVVKTRDRWNEEADALWKEAVAVPLEILSRAGINARGVKYFGKPAQTIAEHARKTGGIVVIGSHGRGNFLQAVLGSTASKLCAVVDQPLLIVRMPSGVLDPKAENDDLPMTPETDWDTCAEPSEPSAASHHGETPNQH
ncbi:universal stress protein, partial [Sutterella wadsworthensis]